MSVDGEGDYDVGYGKPPAHTRFKKGQSGNPSGKRKGVKSSIRQVEKFLQTPLVVNESGRRSRKTPFEITLLKILQAVSSGNIAAAKLIIELQRQMDERHAAVHQEQVNYADAIPRFLELVERSGYKGPDEPRDG